MVMETPQMAEHSYCNYAIFDSLGVVRWIGATRQSLYLRKKQHRRTARQARYIHHDPSWRALLVDGDFQMVGFAFRLTREEALRNEKAAISAFGRKDLGTGQLYNLGDGGLGLLNPTPELRVAKQKAIAGENHATLTAAATATWRGRKHTRRTLAKQRAHIKTPEHREKLRQATLAYNARKAAAATE
jgi:hypothetical protein